MFLMLAVKAGSVYWFAVSNEKENDQQEAIGALTVRKETNARKGTDAAKGKSGKEAEAKGKNEKEEADEGKKQAEKEEAAEGKEQAAKEEAEAANAAAERRNAIENLEVAVLITNSSGKKTHQALTVGGTDAFAISSASGSDTFSSKETVDLDGYFSKKGIRSCSIALTEEGKDTDSGIRIRSMKKGGVFPVYPGKLIVYRSSENDAFYLVNELPLEAYLPGVVSSEMPKDFGLEALKAQAVCARSYTVYVLQKEKKEQAEKGAVRWNLVDTTDDQVYRSGEVDQEAKTACRETRGEILCMENHVIKPHYYSTSWGEKADGAVFEREETTYLEAAAVPQSGVEKINLEFIKKYKRFSSAHTKHAEYAEGAEYAKHALDSASYTSDSASFDAASPWFRWSCRISLLNHFDKKIEKLQVTKRGKGGYASELMIDYKDGSAECIKGANSIRCRFGSKAQVYDLQDGSTRNGLAILPSAFFYIDSETIESQKQTVTLYGGGFGHGFGMSQYGANGMAGQGYDYRDILSYYFADAQIVP